MTSAAQKDHNENMFWRNKKCQLHRENGPAVEYADGSKIWYNNGLRHRENGPAIETESGTKEWWLNGRRHRENGPAIVHPDGTKVWYIHGQLHRENGPAFESANGQVKYYLSNENSPDIEQQVKENMARLQAQKGKQELLDNLSQDHKISVKINISFPKIHKKL